MRYLLNAWKADGVRIGRILDADLKYKVLIISDVILGLCQSKEFNNINGLNSLENLYFNEKIQQFMRNAELGMLRRVETILGELKSGRGAVIGYLVIDDLGKVEIRSCEEMTNRIKDNKIILTNGVITTRIVIAVGVPPLEITNTVKEYEMSKAEISDLYTKYKSGVKIEDKIEESKKKFDD